MTKYVRLALVFAATLMIAAPVALADSPSVGDKADAWALEPRNALSIQSRKQISQSVMVAQNQCTGPNACIMICRDNARHCGFITSRGCKSFDPPCLD